MMEDLQLNLDWVERFALAERREEVLASLAAGTKEHFFFSLLHLINTNKDGQHTKEIEKLLDDFGRVYSKGMLYQKAELRHKFVSFANASAAERQDTIQWLIRELNLHFNDAPPRENAQSGQASRAPLHPTVLDQKLIDPFDDKTTTKDISNFTPMAFHRLAKTELNKKQLKELLHSEEANNIENVVQLIKEDIALSKCSFGERAVHSQLSLEQMEELRALKPDIVDSSTFIDLYIAKLNPTGDVDLDRDLEARERYINKLWSFVNGLAGSFNQLKAVVLYHKLDLLRKQGNYDEDLFLQYLAVPRHTTYNHEKAFVNQHDVATLSVGVGLLGGMHSDEKLVKAYLKHFFENEKTTGIKPYQHYIRDTFLERQFAKAKLLSGQITSENAEVMNNMLGGKHQLEALRKKVQIKFSVDNKEYFGHDEQVNLHLKVKNVPTLIVKVFEINTTAFYKDNKREVSEDINLDGLVAKHEEVHNYEESPMRSHTETFSFPVLNHRGVYVIEFIGNGQRNRAVIRKGSLRLLAKPSGDGDILSIIDEDDSIMKGDADTEIWLDGHILKPDPITGQVLAPFTSHSSTQVVVITHQGFSSLAMYQSSAESYSLHAGFYVDRESLIKLQQATVFVRASLLMNARPVSLDLLEDVTLSITCRDKDGIPTNSEVKDFALFENKDSKYAFLVPENARSFSFTLSGHVTKRSPTPDREDDKAHLSDSSSFTLNEIDDSNLLEDLHLAYCPDGYRIYVLGKSGEPRPGRVIALQLWNVYRTRPFNVTLQTNDDGFAFLGPLQNVYKIECLGEYGKLPKKKWKLRHASFSYPRNIQAPARQPLRVPYLPAQLDREHVSFFQFVDYNTPLHNRFALMDLDGGFIVIGRDGGLAPGKYNLLLRDDYNHQDTIKIVVVEQQEEQDEKGKSTEGKAQSAQGDSSFVFAKGGRKVFELNHESAAHIADITILGGGDQSEEKGKEIGDASAPPSSQGSERIRIKIGNAKQSTRVHCICNTLLPPWDLLRLQLNATTADPIQHDIGFSRPRSIFLKKQAISQEHRYILDRKYGTKRRGNMLPSPTLLLNMREATSLGEPPHMLNDMYSNAMCAEACMAPCASRRGMEEKRRMMKKCREAGFLAEAQELSSNLDFLGEAAAVVLNLKPDSQGFVELSRQEHLLIGTYLQVAVIEGNSLSFRTITLPPIHPAARSTLSGEGYRLKYKDMCLHSQALDTSKHFTEQRQVSVLADGGSFGVKDLSTALIETYDTLSKAFHLLRTLCSDAASLGQFDWILSWPSLSEKEKLEKYSKFASHELHFFIFKKDKPFFDQYITPFLRNKKDKTFLDFWLLEEKTWLLHFLPLHHFESLNVVEQILLGTIVKESNPEHAQYIAKYIRDSSSLFQKDNAEFSRFVFDTALKGRGLDTGAESYGEGAGRGIGGGGRRERSVGSRGGIAFFEGIGEVKQWAERNYWSLQTPQQTGELITPNPFWADYAGHLLVSGSSSSAAASAFVSAHFGEAHRNFAEVMMAIAVLDLPFEQPRHDITYAEGGMRMIAKSPAVIFHKQIKESQVEFSANVLVSQNYIDPRAPLRGDDEEQEFSRYNTNLEFLVGKEYACEVVLTNVGKSTQKLSLLLQIPVGAMPLNKGFFTQSKYLQLAPNSTQQVSYSFYFPKAEGEQCEFQHLPVQVCKNEKVICDVPNKKLKVVHQLSEVNTRTWAYVAGHGSEEDLLRYLKEENLLASSVNLDLLGWRAKENAALCQQILEILASRFIYHDKLWSYALYHYASSQEEALLRFICEYLQRQTLVLQRAAPLLRSPLLQLNTLGNEISLLSEEQKQGLHSLPILFSLDVSSSVPELLFEYLEYHPLVNARAHPLEGSNHGKVSITETAFRSQYTKFLHLLSHKPREDFSNVDLMVATYYLLLQDRVEDAQQRFAQVQEPNAENNHLQLQYDYLTAFLDFYNDEPKVARAISSKYASYPIPHWNKRFAEIKRQLNELEGVAMDEEEASESADRNRRMERLASSQATFDFSIESKHIHIDYSNLTECTISYFEMDIELLFSTNPFSLQNLDQFSFVTPNAKEVLSLPPATKTSTFKHPIPPSFDHSNIIVCVSGGGLTKSHAHYSHSLNVQLFENYGQLKVTDRDSHKPLSKAYVKVYQRNHAHSEPYFYKDGYTDLRGRFDYATLNGNALQSVQRFSILVLSDNNGAVIKEAAPPKQH